MFTLSLTALLLRFTLVGAVLAASATVQAAGDASRGEALHVQQCTGCHAVDRDEVGPAHRGVYGRHVAADAAFDYSPALKRKAALVWNEATLDQWLAAPEKFAPGQAMGVSVRDPAARADLIAYLRSLRNP
jgi:cytochrome c